MRERRGPGDVGAQLCPGRLRAGSTAGTRREKFAQSLLENGPPRAWASHKMG